MKVLDPGHRYSLSVLDIKDELPYTCHLQFVKRIGEKFPGNQPPAEPGTTVQEVLRAVVDRLAYVNNQQPHQDTREAQLFVEMAIWHLERRAAIIHERPVPNPHEAIYGVTCPKCGHVGCEGKCHLEKEIKR
jgi:hypothetical protein